MSYDIYCYQPTSETPSATEAQALFESFNADEEAGRQRKTLSDVRERIASALMERNPGLERFQFGYAEIAKTANISEQEARERYRHIELNRSSEGDLAIQLTIYDDHVCLTVPYWYSGSEADQVFSQLLDYLRVVRRTAGFFAYDPQTDIAFDPERTGFLDHAEYDRVVRDVIPGIVGKEAADSAVPKKPWWKVW